jgi:hypothetical protein
MAKKWNSMLSCAAVSFASVTVPVARIYYIKLIAARCSAYVASVSLVYFIAFDYLYTSN